MLAYVKSKQKLTSGSFTPCKITCSWAFGLYPRCLLKAIGFSRMDPGVRQGGDEDQQRGPGAEEVETLVAQASMNPGKLQEDLIPMGIGFGSLENVYPY